MTYDVQHLSKIGCNDMHCRCSYLGRLRQKDLLDPGVWDQPEQHSKTPSQKIFLYSLTISSVWSVYSGHSLAFFFFLIKSKKLPIFLLRFLYIFDNSVLSNVSFAYVFSLQSFYLYLKNDLLRFWLGLDWIHRSSWEEVASWQYWVFLPMKVEYAFILFLIFFIRVSSYSLFY
jgi:hypothetical protein